MFVAIERRSMATAIFVLMGDEQNKDGARHVTSFDIYQVKSKFDLIWYDMHLILQKPDINLAILAQL